jgi:uncharacterized protein YgiM (DUF1202 family)
MAGKSIEEVEAMKQAAEVEAPTKPKKEYVTVKATTLFVRQAPSPGGKVVRVAQQGERLEVLERLAGWIRVKDGYVMAEFVE